VTGPAELLVTENRISELFFPGCIGHLGTENNTAINWYQSASVTITIDSSTDGAKTLSRMIFSRHVGLCGYI